MNRALTIGVGVGALALGIFVGTLLRPSAPAPVMQPAASAQALSAPASAAAAGAPADAPASPGPVPKTVTLVPATHDYGKMLEGESRSVRLAVKRPDGTKLRLTRVYSPCPCIFVTTGNRTLGPGEETYVDVAVHSLTLAGKVTFPAYVEVAEPEEGVLRADVTLEVERVPAQMTVRPDTMQLGAVAGPKTVEVALTNLTKQPIEIGAATCTLDGAQVTIVNGSRIDAGTTHTVKLEVDRAKLAAGPIRGQVLLSTNCPAHKTIAIPVEGTAR